MIGHFASNAGSNGYFWDTSGFTGNFRFKPEVGRQEVKTN